MKELRDEIRILNGSKKVEGIQKNQIKNDEPLKYIEEINHAETHNINMETYECKTETYENKVEETEVKVEETEMKVEETEVKVEETEVKVEETNNISDDSESYKNETDLPSFSNEGNTNTTISNGRGEKPLEESNTITLDELNKKKLPELKKLAEENNIVLMKMDNGKMKNKTKVELASEIFESLNSK
jgi:hypothetical protein